MFYAETNSRTKRREDRRQVRNTLGNSRDDVPNLWVAVRAAWFLDRIVQAASNGSYTLRIDHFGDILTPTEALSEIKEEGYER